MCVDEVERELVAVLAEEAPREQRVDRVGLEVVLADDARRRACAASSDSADARARASAMRAPSTACVTSTCASERLAEIVEQRRETHAAARAGVGSA